MTMVPVVSLKLTAVKAITGFMADVLTPDI